jgi:DNA-binding NarL/FixJ family response regulator
MSTSPSVHVTDSEERDIFDSLESCEKLITAREVARILSISEKTVYSYVSRNLIPHPLLSKLVFEQQAQVAD